MDAASQATLAVTEIPEVTSSTRFSSSSDSGNIKTIYLCFGNAISTNMGPKFLCVFVTQSFERAPSKVTHATPRFVPVVQYFENLFSNLQQSAIKIIYIYIFF